MSIQPEGEVLRKAINFISEEKKAAPATPFGKLVDSACMKFDLSPKDAEFLVEFYRNAKDQSDPD